MAIIQPYLELPAGLAVRIAAGELRLDGGVVRSAATGRIVKHLDDAVPAKHAQEGVQAAVSRASGMARTTTTVVVAGAVVVVAIAGTAVWAWKRSQATKADNVDTIDLESALAAYLDAARQGRLDVVTIRQLITSLDETAPAAETDTLARNADEVELLVAAVAEHTRQLALANHQDLDVDLGTSPSDGSQVGRLRHYLQIQEQIVASAA